jgi:TolB protein
VTTRRILLGLIALLSLFILVGGAGLAGLTYLRLADRPAAQQLIVLDAGRLLLLDADGDERVLAEDLSGDVFRYPSLAPDGERIAYIGRDDSGATLHSLHLGTGARTELYRSADAPPLYLSWSTDGRTVSFLTNQSQGGLGVYLVAADGAAEAELLDTTASSSYFAWQPAGDRLLLHIGGSSFEGGRVAVYQPGANAPASELRDPGFFQAPAWSSDGSAIFYVAQPAIDGPLTPERVESVLTRVPADGGEPTVLAREQRRAIFFSRAPGSDTIAYTTAGPNGFGVLKVVDAGGEPRVVSRPDDVIPAFFWSPDGSSLAYLTIDPQPGGPPRLTWHVVSSAGGEVRELTSFTPSPAFVGLVSFFDAYALSLDLWSPDGSSLVYGTDEGVYVLDVASGSATRRAAGSLGLWARP